MRFISKRILEKFISVSNKDTWACDIIISSFQGRGVAMYQNFWHHLKYCDIRVVSEKIEKLCY